MRRRELGFLDDEVLTVDIGPLVAGMVLTLAGLYGIAWCAFAPVFP